MLSAVPILTMGGGDAGCGAAAMPAGWSSPMAGAELAVFTSVEATLLSPAAMGGVVLVLVTSLLGVVVAVAVVELGTKPPAPPDPKRAFLQS